MEPSPSESDGEIGLEPNVPNEPTIESNSTIDSGQNLELFVSAINREPLGNGMDMFSVSLIGKNASTGWHFYDLASWRVCDGICICYWDLIPNESFPLLKTTEGYEYIATSTMDPICGYRKVYSPPGLTFTSFSYYFGIFTRDDPLTYHVPYVEVHFEIAEGVTPDSITLYYLWDRESGNIATKVIDLNDNSASGNSNNLIPFDLNFANSIFGTS